MFVRQLEEAESPASCPKSRPTSPQRRAIRRLAVMVHARREQAMREALRCEGEPKTARVFSGTGKDRGVPLSAMPGAGILGARTQR